MKLLILSILSAYLGSSLAWGGYKINFEHNDLDFDENLVSVDISMKRADEKTIVNIRAEQFEDIEDPIILHVSQYEKINGDYQNLANSSLDVCNIVSRVKTHPLLKLIIKELLKSSNFQTSCPLRKGIYHMKDFSLNEELLPPFIPLGSFMSKIRMSRSVDGEELPFLKMTLYIDIDNAKERKSHKLF